MPTRRRLKWKLLKTSNLSISSRIRVDKSFSAGRFRSKNNLWERISIFNWANNHVSNVDCLSASLSVHMTFQILAWIQCSSWYGLIEPIGHPRASLPPPKIRTLVLLLKLAMSFSSNGEGIVVSHSSLLIERRLGQEREPCNTSNNVSTKLPTTPSPRSPA